MKRLHKVYREAVILDLYSQYIRKGTYTFMEPCRLNRRKVSYKTILILRYPSSRPMGA